MCVYDDAGEVAVYINSSRPGHFPRGGQHAILLEMLQPSLAAGVAILRGVGRAREDPRLLDAASSALGIFRLDGELLHAVPKFAALLRDESKKKDVWADLQSIAKTYAALRQTKQ